MVDQPSLFDPPTARFGDPDTSQGAAVIALHRAAAHRQMALEALIEAGEHGMTDFALAEATGVAQTSIGKRRLDLQRAGLVVGRMVIDPDRGLIQDRRPAPSGAPSLVWVAAEFQRADAAAVVGKPA